MPSPAVSVTVRFSTSPSAPQYAGSDTPVLVPLATTSALLLPSGRRVSVHTVSSGYASGTMLTTRLAHMASDTPAGIAPPGSLVDTSVVVVSTVPQPTAALLTFTDSDVDAGSPHVGAYSSTRGVGCTTASGLHAHADRLPSTATSTDRVGSSTASTPIWMLADAFSYDDHAPSLATMMVLPLPGHACTYRRLPNPAGSVSSNTSAVDVLSFIAVRYDTQNVVPRLNCSSTTSAAVLAFSDDDVRFTMPDASRSTACDDSQPIS